MAPLNIFLDEMAEKGWLWGERDCLLWLGLWSERVTGIDGGAPWRGRYHTALGCARLLNASGGMESCIERGAKLVGMKETSSPEAGSIGLVHTMTDRGIKLAGSIYTGRRWSVMMPNGIATGCVDPVKAWGF